MSRIDLHPGFLVALLLTVVAAIYAPAMGGGYIFDDHLIILNSPVVEELRPFAEYFTRPFFTSSLIAAADYYRPLVVLSFALDYRLHDGAASGLHLTNLALHLVNTALLVAWLRQRGSGVVSATILAALWALHPRLTEAAAWISGRTDVMATTFVFAALIVWRPTTPRRAACALLLFGGLLAKEVALAGLVALCCNEWALLRSRQEAQAPVRALTRSLPYFAALGLYIALRLATVGWSPHGHLAVKLRALGVVEAIGRYAYALAVPWLPDAVQGRMSRPTTTFVALGVLVFAGLVVLFVRRRRLLRPEHAPPLALAAVSLGLALNVVPIPSRMISADRFLYLPLAGLLALAAPALERLWRASAPARLATLALLLSFALFTFRRSAQWADEVAFWIDQYRRASPVEVYVSATALSAVFVRTGLYEEATVLSRRALATGDPSVSDASYNLALALARLGRTSEARPMFEKLAQRDGSRSRYALDLLQLDLQEHRFDQAGRRLVYVYGPRPQGRQQRDLLFNAARMQAVFERLQSDATFAASEDGLVLRAQLATDVGRYDEAIGLWSQVVATTGRPEIARRALAQLIRRHDLAAMQQGVKSVEARFGAMPDLTSAYQVRRAEIEAARAAARELGI